MIRKDVMMKTKSVFKTLVLLFLIAVMCFPVGVFAADNTGSISFTAQTTGDHTIVPDAEFELYKVADYDVSSITLTQGFSGMNLTLLDLQDRTAGKARILCPAHRQDRQKGAGRSLLHHRDPPDGRKK